MDALNFLKFWKHAASSSDPHLAVETDNGSDEEEDSFFDLELTVHDFDNKENNDINNSNPEDKTIGERKLAKRAEESEVDVSEKPVLANEPISKRKILPIEPISKPQSPIALLKSAPSFRISMFKKPKEMAKAESDLGSTPTQEQQKKETKFFALKLDFQEPHYSPSLRRNSSSRSHGSKHRVSGESKSERFSKEVLQKYLKLIKPLYMKISRRYSDKIKFSGDLSSTSPSSSPSLASVSSSRKEKQGNVPSGIKVVCKQLGKSRSASAAATASGLASPARRSDDTLLQQHDGIQSAILHCKRSLNSREYSSTITQSAEKSTNTVRKSFQEENGANI